MKYSTIKGKKNGENPFDLEVEFDIGLIKGIRKKANRLSEDKTKIIAASTDSIENSIKLIDNFFELTTSSTHREKKAEGDILMMVQSFKQKLQPKYLQTYSDPKNFNPLSKGLDGQGKFFTEHFNPKMNGKEMELI